MTATPSAASKERIVEDFNAVVSEAEQLLKTVATLGTDKTGAVREDLDKALSSARGKLAEIRERSIAQACAAAEMTDVYVKENPYRALGVVAVVGALVGLTTGLVIARR